MIELRNISMSFGKRAILDDVNVEFIPGTISAITGKSGAGKTTLLGIISGLLDPDGGEVLFEGKNILKWGDIKRSRFRNKEIGFVFQFFNLLSDITSYQNIIYPALVNLFDRDGDLENDVMELVDYLNIREIIHNYPATLSGGERQRVAIARAIINRPRIILADEPTGNLDDLSAKGIQKLFEKLRDSGICLIVVTHDARIVEMADTHFHLENAKLTKLKGKGIRTRLSKEDVKSYLRRTDDVKMKGAAPKKAASKKGAVKRPRKK